MAASRGVQCHVHCTSLFGAARWCNAKRHCPLTRCPREPPPGCATMATAMGLLSYRWATRASAGFPSSSLPPPGEEQAMIGPVVPLAPGKRSGSTARSVRLFRTWLAHRHPRRGRETDDLPVRPPAVPDSDPRRPQKSAQLLSNAHGLCAAPVSDSTFTRICRIDPACRICRSDSITFFFIQPS